MENQNLCTINYSANFQYFADKLDFLLHAEGYVKAVYTGNTTEYHYVYHYTDHLGNIRLSYGRDPETNEVAILKESHYYPFGLQHQGYVDTHQIFPGIIGVGKVELFPVRNYLDDSYRYTFGGKEEQLELGLNWLDFHARNYMPDLGRWMNVDPLAEEMPSWSPYNYAFNNPVYFIDPDGREPIPSYRRWFGEPRKAWQWYSTAGVYDNKTFHSAAVYSTNNLRASAYQTVYQRNAYYGWVQGQADAKGLNSKWFGAAELVTGFRGVGGTAIPDGGIFTSKTTDKFLQGGNEFLFSHNMKNAKSLLGNGSLSGGFTDANGNKQSFNGLSGMALDNKLVEFEQSKVQDYINGYKGNDLGDIITNINEMMNDKIMPNSQVRDVIKNQFNNKFDFGKYEDRVKLGQELIKKAHGQ